LPDSMVVFGAVLIFLARIFDVSIGTLRIILLVRGKRYTAGALGFVESIIYLTALGFVVDKLDQPINLIMYGLGFATGNIVGSFIEERMAMGYTTAQIISMTRPEELCALLRNEGFGVTVWEGEGREGKHLVLNITLTRRELPHLLRIIDDWDLKAFVTILDAKSTKGGYLLRRKAK